MIYELDDNQPNIHASCFIAPSADVIGKVEIAELCSVWFNVTIRGDTDLIRLGKGSNVQDNSVLHTDPGIVLNIGENVTVGHSVMLHGCEIGSGSLIGIGSVILNNATLGKNCLVGANSLITEGKQFPARSLIMGSPAKVIRELSDEEVAALNKSAQTYMNKIAQYQNLQVIK